MQTATQECFDLIKNRGQVTDIQRFYYRLPLSEQKLIKAELMQTWPGREFLKYLPLNAQEKQTLASY